jgi:phosphomannomutase
MRIFLFDVDNTITPARQKIQPSMANLINSLSDAMVYLVTGSNIEKTIEQCGPLANQVSGVFACSGNAFYVHGKRIFANNWVPPNPVMNWLQNELGKSKYPTRTGNHIELRPGSINFSVVGRNANKAERQDYKLYDMASHERIQIAGRFNKKFSEVTAHIGGDTGIDIAPKGNDKSQVYRYLAPVIHMSPDSRVYFFGDRMESGGNDEPLATILMSSLIGRVQCFSVNGPNETAELIRDLNEREYNTWLQAQDHSQDHSTQAEQVG